MLQLQYFSLYVCACVYVVEEGGGGSRNKAGRTVSSDAVSRKAETHVGVHSQVESPVVPRHHSAEEHAKGGTGGMKRTPASPKDKATAHWNAHVLPLLNKLHASAHNSEELSQLLDDLWEKLSRGNYLGRSGGVGGAKKRSAVLKTVFVLLDSKDPQLLLKVAKILLAVRVPILTYVYTYCMYVRMFVSTTNYVYQFLSRYIYVCMYVCTYVRMYVCTYCTYVRIILFVLYVGMYICVFVE